MHRDRFTGSTLGPAQSIDQELAHVKWQVMALCDGTSSKYSALGPEASRLDLSLAVSAGHGKH